MRKFTWLGLCLLLALPAWGQRGGGFSVGGGGGFRGGGFGRGSSAVVGFGTPGTFGGFGSPFGFGFGTGVFARFRSAGGPTVVGFGTPQNFMNLGIPPIASGLPQLGINAPGSAFFSGILARDTFPGFSLPFWPFWGAYGGYDYFPQQPSPSVIVIQPLSPEMMAAARPKPPEPARPEVRDYKPAAEAEPQPGAAAPSGPQQMFSIALKNGTRDSAIAAWVQDDCLDYLNASGKRQRVALSAVDRPATEMLNRQKNLSLWLPPE